ncbi:energy-coupling factor transporter ATPase [Proteiniclasticum sp. BAD-10]|uniref:Energy-coupling factor transporter ATPase n=2 Tax=Proteiniclasticum sediminis TaxID=2804028 RepID=A0A941CP37_9CLOT|nr:energy-coupling factor transporter ATPase [Proteiniclasticum sediminis]MBR0576275.1 energy-coupling factor transporter ATPase [Proteiniclasticum sediminis]
MIKAVDLTHYYDDNPSGEKEYSLEGVNLTIREGEFVVVLGHNGSGKSTFAKHMNALLLPTGGKIYIDTIDASLPENTWEVRKRAGMVFQNPDNQMVATVVEEDVAFGPENLGVDPDDIRRRVDKSLKEVNMYEFRKHAPHLLSGGQKQRVAIAGIIAMRPKIIILDEPTAMLDPSGRQEVMKTIRQLNEEYGITIVHITHFMEEAVQGDRIVVMEEGKVIIDDTPKNVFKQVDLLHSIGLDVPQVTELAHELRLEGIKLPEGILNIEEMVEELCRLK